MTHEPILTEWELYFDTANGYENRYAVIQAFLDFWGRTSTKKFNIPGKCLLGGKNEHGKEMIVESDVEIMERVGVETNNGAKHDLICATTADGEKYYFYSDEISGYMILMLADLMNLGALNSRRYYYCGHNYYGSRFI